MSNTFYQGRYSISNIQWKIIEPFLPPPKFGGRPALNSRTVFNAILWILGSGAAWRDLPEKYGNWNSIYHKFRNWIEAGVFEKIFQVIVGKCEEYHLVEIDSTFCKVHQHAAGARKILGNQNIGNSRGANTTKIHVLVSLRNQMRLSHTILIKNFIKLATLLNDFLIASNTTDTLQYVTTNCPFAFYSKFAK